MARKKTTNIKSLEYSCLPLKQGEFTLYCFVAKAKEVWSFVSINQRDTDKDSGYQRVLSGSRVNKIARYIDEGNALPNNVLIALDSAKVSKSQKTIQIPNNPEAGWVIDGQHRLAGANKAINDLDVVVIAFIGLNLSDQVKLFVDINREQKGVPTSLYFDLLKQLPPGKTDMDLAKERAANIGKELSKNEESHFLGRIVVNPPKKGEISLTNFVRKITPLVVDKKGKFHVYTLPEQIKILDNYLTALENIFPKEFNEDKYTFFRTLGFGAVMNALPTVFDLTLKQFNSFQVSDVSQILKKINYFDFSKWDQYGTGNAAEIQAGEDFRQELLSFQQDDDSSSIRL